VNITPNFIGGVSSVYQPLVSGGAELVVSADRIFVIEADNRTFAIGADNRNFVIERDNRTFVVTE
jgi:hypothetical protein